MEPESHLPFVPLATPAAFTEAYGQLFILLEERPLRLPELRTLWAAIDEYAQRHPCPTWPIVMVDARGNRRELATLADLLLQLSLDIMPLN